MLHRVGTQTITKKHRDLLLHTITVQAAGPSTPKSEIGCLLNEERVFDSRDLVVCPQSCFMECDDEGLRSQRAVKHSAQREGAW